MRDLLIELIRWCWPLALFVSAAIAVWVLGRRAWRGARTPVWLWMLGPTALLVLTELDFVWTFDRVIWPAALGSERYMRLTMLLAGLEQLTSTAAKYDFAAMVLAAVSALTLGMAQWGPGTSPGWPVRAVGILALGGLGCVALFGASLMPDIDAPFSLATCAVPLIGALALFATGAGHSETRASGWLGVGGLGALTLLAASRAESQLAYSMRLGAMARASAEMTQTMLAVLGDAADSLNAIQTWIPAVVGLILVGALGLGLLAAAPGRRAWTLGREGIAGALLGTVFFLWWRASGLLFWVLSELVFGGGLSA